MRNVFVQHRWSNIYQKIRDEFEKIVEENDLLGEKYECKIIAKGYAEDPPESGDEDGVEEHNFRLPSKDYALAKGEEVIVRCRVGDGYGDAFTDEPRTGEGEVEEVFELVDGDRGDRAVFTAVLNATLDHLGMIEDTIHCEEGDPKKCGEELREHISEEFGDVKVAHIGFQPGHLRACSERFEGFVTDLNPENIGEEKFGREIMSGEKNEETIEKADVVCITGSTLVNGALPRLLGWCEEYDTEPIVYGVSGKGAVEILGLHGLCPYSRDEP